MGQVVAFPVPPTPYPDLTTDLDTAECVLLVAVRSWVECLRQDVDPLPRLCRELETAGALEAAFPIDGLMTVVLREVTRQVEIRDRQCPDLSLDEKNLLLAASVAQAGDSRLAERVLRTTLLSGQGADFAIRPLEGLGALFAEARLFLTQRRVAAAPRSGREAWSLPRVLH